MGIVDGASTSEHVIPDSVAWIGKDAFRNGHLDPAFYYLAVRATQGNLRASIVAGLLNVAAELGELTHVLGQEEIGFSPP
jgi:hypothetical protein